jgi:hypothetical protein
MWEPPNWVCKLCQLYQQVFLLWLLLFLCPRILHWLREWKVLENTSWLPSKWDFINVDASFSLSISYALLNLFCWFNLLPKSWKVYTGQACPRKMHLQKPSKNQFPKMSNFFSLFYFPKLIFFICKGGKHSFQRTFWINWIQCKN